MLANKRLRFAPIQPFSAPFYFLYDLFSLLIYRFAYLSFFSLNFVVSHFLVVVLLFTQFLRSLSRHVY